MQRATRLADAWQEIVDACRGDAPERAETASAIRAAAAEAGELLLTASFEPERAETLGAWLASLGLGPEGLARSQRALMDHLTDGLPPDTVARLQPRLSGLVSGLTRGFLTWRPARTSEAVAKAKEAALDASTTAVALWGLDGTVTYVNEALAAVWGYDDAGEVEGGGIGDLFSDEEVAATIASSVERLGGWIGKLTARRKDGSSFQVMLAASLIERDKRAPAWVLGCFTDLTYRERLSTMLYERVNRLRVLQEIDRGLVRARDPEDIGRAALDGIRELIPCRSASVVLFDLDEGAAELLAAVPEPREEPVQPGARIPLEGLDRPLSVLSDGDVFHTSDVLRLPLTAAIREVLRPRAPQACTVVPLRWGEQLLGSLNLALHAECELTGQQAAIAREVADSLAVAIRHARLHRSVVLHRERLRALTARLAEADEAERGRLAGDLHDQIGQKLTALAINLSVIKALLGEDAAPEVLSRLDDAGQLVKATTDQVRCMIADLRPPMLDDYGLLPTLRWCGEILAERTGVHVEVRGENPDPRLPPRAEDALVRITQEALTNVAKHARASRVTITLSEERETVRLIIEDDGVGFDPAAEARAGSETWGLVTMTERAEAVGGCCRTESQPGEGTSVIVEVAR
jgi:PAS domain S-box-containing protein